MTRISWLRLCGSAASATVTFLFSSALLVSGIGAQTAESISAVSSLKSPVPSTFLVAPEFPLGYAPSSVATGDLTGGGKLDLVTANYSLGKVTVFAGQGQGNFAGGVDYASGLHPTSVVLADVNGDGKLDVVVANQLEGTISVLLGAGDRSLTAPKSYKLGFNASYIAVGDFSGNGTRDLAVAGKAGNLAILLSDGNGGFKAPVSYALAKAPRGLIAASLRGSSFNDLALANSDGSVSVFLGQGAGVFRQVADFSVGTGALSSIAASDFNKDGKIDLVVTQPGSKTVSVLAGKGDGTFEPASSYAVGNVPVSTLIADFDGDGAADLVVVNSSSNTFSVLGGNGDGTFRNSADFVAGNAPLAAVAGDFYGTGHLDLAIINHASQTITVPQGNGDLSFKAGRSFVAGQMPVSIASGNLSGGKVPALVVGNYCGSDHTCASAGNVAVFLADSKGNYALSATYPVGAGPVSVALADLNGDKNLDIIALNRIDRTASVLLGAGDGTFRGGLTFALAGAPIGLGAGDLNKDGKIDLAVLEDCGASKCTTPGSVEILAGAGDGSFKSLMSYPVEYSPNSISVGDLLGNKNLAIVVANRCGQDASCLSAGTASVLLGDGTGAFKAAKDVALGKSPASIALASLTGSGLDLLVSRAGDNTVAVLRGNGDGTFQTAAPYPVGNNPGAVAFGDFNGDGKLDAAVANLSDSTVSVLSGVGDGTLAKATSMAVGSGPMALTAIGGLNGGHASIATANGGGVSGAAGSEISLLQNLGGGATTFTTFGLASSLNPSNVNDPVTLTATVTTGATVPTANVEFYLGTTPLADCGGATGEAVAGAASPYTSTCTLSSLPLGAADSLTAEYLGDATYADQTTAPLSQEVDKLSPTLGLVTSSASVVYGQSITFTAQLGTVNLTPITPGGTVKFTVGGTTISSCGTQAVDSSGQATCITTALALGNNQTIGAVYSGDTNFATATATTITESVTQASTTLALGTSSASVPFNDPITFTATVSAVAPGSLLTAPGGTVKFTVGGSTISGCGTKGLTAGVASCTATLPLGANQTIGAVYTGDTNLVGSTATTISQTVTQAGTTLGLGTSSATVGFNTSVTFTATLSATAPGALTPTAPGGSVNFTVGGSTISGCGTQSLTAGVATCTTTGLAVGANQTIGAVYTGDTNFAGSTATTISQTVQQLAPTLTLTTPLSTTNFNASVTFTATLSGVNLTPTAPTGSVAFTIGTTTLCATAPLTAGVATCTTTALVIGANQTVKAVYTGDTNFAGKTAPTISQTVVQLAPTLTTTTSGATNVNQSVTLTATLSGVSFTPTGPGGTVGFTVGGTAITSCTAQAVNSTDGKATCTTSTLVEGSDQIVATYSGDTNYKTATAPAITQTVSALAATVGIAAVPAGAVNVDTSVKFTAQLAATALTPVTPSGTITWAINGAASADCPATTVTAGGSATCTTSSLLFPADVVTATYSGDSNFTAAAAGTITETVGKATAATTLSSSPASPVVNQPTTFTATVKPASGTEVEPTGSVTFTQGATTLCTAAAINTATQTATCNYTFGAVTAGSTITATYSGEQNFSAGTPGTTNEVVTAASTTTTVTANPNPSATSQQVTFTATIAPVSPAGATPALPTGTVTFKAGSTTLCSSVTITPGTPATCNYTFTSASTYNVVATYATGDSNFTGSVSNTYPQSVGSGTTSVALTSTLNPTSVNQSVTFNAAINFGGGATNPTGTVIYSDGATPICTYPATGTSTFTAGVVPSCTVAFTSQGTHSITAKYNGDTNFSGATSNTVSQVVNTTTTTTSVTSSPNPSAVNQQVIFTATVTPAFTAGGVKPTGTVTYTDTTTSTALCSNLPLVAGAVATCPYTFTTPGPNNVVATYTTGDTNFASSASGATADVQSVNAGATTVTLGSSLSPSTVNQSVTFTSTIAATSGTSTPTGTVAFTYSGPQSGILCAAQPVATVATVTSASCTAPLPAAGTFTITSTYSGDTNFGGNSKTLSQKVNLTSTTTTVALSPSTVTTDEPVTFTATVAPGVTFFTGATTPTGTVNFSYSLNGGGSVALCTGVSVNTVGGVTTAACSGQVLPVAGSYSIQVTYAGDSNFTTSLGSTPETVAATATATMLVSSPNPSAVNQNVTFTATVTPAYPGATKPTGTVTFTNTTSSTVLCSGLTIAAGVVPVCQVPFASAGTFDVVATYTSGDSNFSGSASGATADVQSVGSASTSVSLASSLPAGSFVNEPVTFNATINFVTSGLGQPTGTVTYSDGGTAIPGCTFTATAGSPFTGGSVPPCSIALATSGSHSIKATYSGDSNFSTSASSVFSQAVSSAVTTTSVVSSPNPSGVGSSVAFTATISPAYTAGTAKPTGSVTFTNTTSGTTLCSALSVTAGVVPVCNYTFTGSGTFDVVATYTGDTNFVTSASGATADVQTVGASATVTTLASTFPAGSAVNQAVTFTGSIAYTVSGTTVPTGTVVYKDGATTLCTFASFALNVTGSGTGTFPACSPNLYTAGTHAIQVIYSGDTNFTTSSGTFAQAVTAVSTTTTATGFSTAALDTPIVFTATVTPGFSPTGGSLNPTGTVTFTYAGAAAGTPCASVAVVGAAGAATATCSIQVPKTGSYTITATYSGDGNFNATSVGGSTSVTAPFSVALDTTAASLTTSSPVVVATQLVTYTAVMTPTGTPGTALSGTVTFSSSDGTLNKCGPSQNGVVQVTGGLGGTAVATCSVLYSSASAGVSITANAVYSGDGNFLTSRASTTQTVQNFTPAFSAPTTGTVLLTQGFNNTSDPLNPQAITVTITPAAGFSDALGLTCTVTNATTTQQVTDPSCLLSPSTLPGTGGTYGAVTVTITASASAPVAAYSVQITASDTTVTTLSHITATPLTVYVTGVATALTVAPGVTGASAVIFNTAGSPSPDILSSFSCGNIEAIVNGAKSGSPFSSTGKLTCSGTSATVTGGSTTAQVSITPVVSATAQLTHTSTMSLAAVFGIPLFALIGWVGSRKSPRRNFFRFIGLVLLMIGVSYAVTGCGTGISTGATIVPTSVLPAGSYDVQVIAKDSGGNLYYAVVPLTVKSDVAP